MTTFYRQHVQMYFDSNQWGHFSLPISSHEIRFIQFAPGTRLNYIKGYIARTSADYIGPLPILSSPSSLSPSSIMTTTTTTTTTRTINDHECKSIFDQYYIVLLILIQMALILILINITLVTWQKYINYQKELKEMEFTAVQHDKLKTNNLLSRAPPSPPLPPTTTTITTTKTDTQEPPYYYEIVDIVQQDLV